MDERYPKDTYYDAKRFQQPTNKKDFESPYDMESALLQDLIARKIEPFISFLRIDLSSAGSKAFNVSGRAIVFYGSDGTNVHMVNTQAYCDMQLEVTEFQDGQPIFPMKHGRGYRGPFTKFVLNWPAQTGIFIDVVVHRYKDLPWIDGSVAT